MSDAINKLDLFLKWLEETHPEVFMKYGRNFTTSFKDGETVAVNNNYKVSIPEFDMLVKILHDYEKKS